MRHSRSAVILHLAVFFNFLIGQNPASAFFESNINYNTGANPIDSALGDFNGDGNIDIAVANASANHISVLLGHGDGTFDPSQSFVAGSNLTGIAAAHFNGDSVIDIVVCNWATASISLLIGNGDGTFQSPVQFPNNVAGNPNGLTVGDFNGDTKTDVVVASGSSNISVHLGNGDGSFQSAVSVAVASLSKQVESADLNHDGRLDLAVTGGGVSILLGNGDGTFQPFQNWSTAGNEPLGVVIEDFNGDTQPDIAAVNAHSHNIAVLLGNGDGTFQAAVLFPIGQQGYGINAGDLNMDGFLDLIASNEISNDISVLYGRGDGTFEPEDRFLGFSDPVGITVSDLNGDNAVDVIVANYDSNLVSVLVNALLPPNPIAEIDALIAYVNSLPISQASKNVAISRLNLVKTRFNSGNVRLAREEMYAFIRLLEQGVAQHIITVEQGNVMLEQSGIIIGALRFT